LNFLPVMSVPVFGARLGPAAEIPALKFQALSPNFRTIPCIG
jgi:hypothetical protein